MSNHSMKEVLYRCTNDDCKHEQTVRYFPDEAVNPALCCVKCQAGFGVDHREMVLRQIGMIPVGKPRMTDDEPKFWREGAFTKAGAVA